MREKKVLRERGALPKEEGDAVREYKAMHEESFLSSWLREDGGEKEKRTVEMSGENEERDEEEKGKEKRAKQGLLKEDVTMLFLWKPWKFLSRVRSGELW